MKLKTVPKDIEDYVNAIQLKVNQEAQIMSKHLNMSRKDFQFLADVIKKCYASALEAERVGVVWTEKLLTEELKSRCPSFNVSLWNEYVGYQWIKNDVTVPEQDQHDEAE